MFDVAPGLQEKLRTIRSFLETRVIPLEAELQETSFAELVPKLTQLRQEVKTLGLLAPHMPVEYGGLGLPLTHFARVSEEIGRSPLGHYVFNCAAPDAGNMELLHEVATPEQKRQWLLPLVEGRIRSCFSMTEPEFPGSNPTQMATRAVRQGDHYVIDGHKWFTSGAEGSSFAIVMAVTNPKEEKPHQRASMIVVPTDTPGFHRVRNVPVMGEAGSDWASHAEIRYENCRVPAANLLGKEGEGFKLAQVRLGPGRIQHCMRWIGVSERCLEMMIDRASSRQISPGESLASKQTVQTWIAESRAEIDAARLLVLSAAEKIEREGSHAARVEVSCIKFFVPDVMLRVIDRAVQVHGALGMTDDLILSWWYRHERASRIYDGPDEVHKEVVARHLVRQRREPHA